MFIHRLKLRPPQLTAGWIDRPVLTQRVGGSARVVAVVAGPGYGKTMLAGAIAARWSGRLLWYSVDASDSDLAVFTAHLDAGLRTWERDFRPFDVDNAAALGSPREIGTRFAEVLTEMDQPALLVFDDVHSIEGSRTLDALTELIERGTRAGATFLLCGRSMPIGLHRIAAAGGLVTVGPDDLAFGHEETQKFLEGISPNLNAGNGAIEALAARAEGWPAGLALIARSAPGVASIAPQAHSASGDEARRWLFEYLAKEVLETLDAEPRRFLLETSILERLEIAACEALGTTPRAAEILDDLVDRGLFVSRRAPDAYTLHQLFREFLLQELARTYAGAHVAALHARAARYYERSGDPVRAIHHALEAGDLDSAAHRLERAGFALLQAGMIGAVSRLMERVGEERVAASAALTAVRGRLERERGDWDVALLTLNKAVALARSAQQYDVLAETVRFIAPILASRNDMQRLESMLNEALSLGAHLPESSVTSLRMTLAAVQLESDRLDEALSMYREITPKLVARGDLAGQGLVLHNVAVAHLRRGELYAGLSTYERALKFKEDAGHRASVLHTLGDIVYVKTIIGDLEEAERLVRRLVDQATDLGMAATIARAHEQLGAIALLRGDIKAAAQAYRAAQAACDPSDVRILPDIEHGLAQCELHNGNVKQAEFLVARAAAAYRSAGRLQQLAPLLLTQARCALHGNDYAAAARFTLEAIQAAGRGSDLLLECTAALDAADVLMSCAAKARGGDITLWESSAKAAAARSVALIHERDYRFLLRTRAETFARLRPQLRRWGIGETLLPSDQAAELIESMRIEMFGTFAVHVNGRRVGPDAWKRRKAPELFAFLLSQHGRAVPRSKLIDLFWPDSEADAAHDNLRVTVTAIRKAVGDVVRYESNAYRFEAPPDVFIDTERFDAHVAKAREADTGGDVAATRREYAAAIELYRGEYLEGFPDTGWQWRERERFRADTLESLRWLARDSEAAGDAASARHFVERLLEVSPFDLEAVRMRLDSLARENRMNEAIRAYAVWRSRYRQAVGAEPPAIWDAQGFAQPPTAAAAEPAPAVL